MKKRSNELRAFYNRDFVSPVVWVEPPFLLDLSGAKKLTKDRIFEVGQYAEDRSAVYSQDLFTGDQRTFHVGIDLGAPAWTPVFAPFGLEFMSDRIISTPGDYGCSLLFAVVPSEAKAQCKMSETEPLYVLFGHLAHASQKWIRTLTGSNRTVEKGTMIGWLGDAQQNGGWPAHLHLQLSRHLPLEADLPGVVRLSDRETALIEFPDPSFLYRPFVSPS